MSPKRLAGWEPATTYRQVDGGWVAEVEPEWDEEQVALLLAAQELAKDIGGHGHPLSEAMSPEADPNNRAGSYYYEAEGPTIDWAAKALADRQDAYAKQYPDAQTSGFLWGVRKKTRGTAS